jgi:dihydroorotase
MSGAPDQSLMPQAFTFCQSGRSASAICETPAIEYREDIIRATRAAARGGFTTIACMPNTRPVVDNPAIVHYIREKAARGGFCKVLPIGAVSKNQEGRELAEIGLMAEAGIVAVSDDGKPVPTADLMKKSHAVCRGISADGYFPL